MNECLLCATSLIETVSWKSLFGLERQTKMCADCSKSFQRADIIEENDLIDRITSLYTYNEAMKEYLHQYKFLQDITLATVFKNELREALKADGTIVPIPIHPQKKVVRTFSHVEQLLIEANVSYEDVLKKTSIDVMGEKSKAERLAMATQFRVKSNVMIQPKTYVLVDDIFTTGTTLRHAATVLKDAGATRVEAVTLIRA